MAEERGIDKVWQNNFLKKIARHLCNWRTVIPLVIVLLGIGLYFLPQTRLHRAASNQLYAILQDGQVQNLRQMVTEDNSTQRRIMWQSASPMEAPQVMVRLAGSEEGELRYDAVQDFWADDGSENYQYTVLLDNLHPGTEYEYAIIDKDSRSGWYRLQTASADKPFKMLIFPDSQSADYSGWQKLAQAAWERNQGAELVVNMGDLVDNGEDSSQWRAWFRGLDNIISQSAFVPVMGNHECYDKNWQMRLPAAYLGYFQTPANGSSQYDRYYYSFDYGAVHFVVLCTSDYELAEFQQDLLAEQLAWLRQDLSSSDKPWKVVLMHRDVLQYRIHNRPERLEGFSEEGVAFMPVFEEFNVDAVLTAHLHTYRNRGHLFQRDSADKGPVYILTGVAGDVRYPNLWIDHALDRVTAPQPENGNYLTMEAAADTLDIRCYLADGTQIDEIKFSLSS